MAVKKALVLGSDGRPQQLQSGDTLSGGAETGNLTLTAAATLIAGQAVYASAAATVNKAQANAAAAARCVGLAQAAITSSATGVVQTNGIVTLSTAQWDAVAGTTGGLTFGTTYYVDPATAGLITATCPTTVGQYVVIVGAGLSTVDMKLNLDEPVLL